MIIAFKDVKYPHTGVAIEKALMKYLTDYGSKGKKNHHEKLRWLLKVHLI